ncbi:hypothetical protein ACWDTP_11095 [Mycobacterium sp. NPDC003449]
MSSPVTNGTNRKPRLRLFDIRSIIGALMGIYGVVLLIAGLAPAILAPREDGPADNRVDLYIGTDANWWVGLILVVVAAIFFAWAYFRPVSVEEPAADTTPPEPHPGG